MPSRDERPKEFPDELGFSMAPFGYTFTSYRSSDGAYGCRGKDGCHAKYWPNVGEFLEEFKARVRVHVDAAH